MKEYEEDELAENSDDEKRLFRAEARAGRKNRQMSIKNSNSRRMGQSASANGTASGPLLSRPPVSGVAELAQASMLMQNLLSPLAAKQSLPGSSGSSSPGPCFTCGKLGHVRKSCPLLQGSVVSKTL